MYLTSLRGSAKRADISDECAQGEGHHFPDAAEPDDGQELRVGQHFLGNQTAPVISLLVGMAQFHEHPFDDLPLAGRPVLEFAELCRCLGAFGQWDAFG